MWSLFNRRTVFFSHPLLQPSEKSTAVQLAVWNTTLCKTLWTALQHISHFSTARLAPPPADSVLHRNEKKCVLSSNANCWNSKVLEAPLHQLVSLISGCCLLSLLWPIDLHTVLTQPLTHCPNTASLFCHGYGTALNGHNCIFCTFLLYSHHWRQVRSFQFSRFVGYFCCVVSDAPWTRWTDRKKTNCFPDFLRALFFVSPSALFFSWLDRPNGNISPLWDSSIIIGRTPLDEWSARRRDLYLTAHNTHKR